MVTVRLLPSWVVDRLPIDWWRPGNLHRLPIGELHFCDEDHTRSVEWNGRVVAQGKRLFPQDHDWG